MLLYIAGLSLLLIIGSCSEAGTTVPAVDNGPYNITYLPNVNDDSVSGLPEDTAEYEKYSHAAVLAGEPTRSGFHFVGWNSEPDGSGAYTFWTGDTIFMGKDKAVYAQWVPDSATLWEVDFIPDGGEAEGPRKVVDGGMLSRPKAYSKDGFVEGGWYTESGFANRWDFAVNTVAGNMTLYGKWIPYSENMVENGEFFEGLDFWATGGWGSSLGGDVSINSGTVEIESDGFGAGNGGFGIYQNWPITGGNFYEFSCDYLGRGEGHLRAYLWNDSTRTQHVMMDVQVSQTAHHRYIFQAEEGLNSDVNGNGTGLSIIISEQDEENARVSVDNVIFKPRDDLASIFDENIDMPADFVPENATWNPTQGVFYLKSDTYGDTYLVLDEDPPPVWSELDDPYPEIPCDSVAFTTTNAAAWVRGDNYYYSADATDASTYFDVDIGSRTEDYYRRVDLNSTDNLYLVHSSDTLWYLSDPANFSSHTEYQITASDFTNKGYNELMISSIRVDNVGDLYVGICIDGEPDDSDDGYDCVLKFDGGDITAGPIDEWGGKQRNWMFNTPVDIAFDSNNLMYVLGRNTEEILVFDPDMDTHNPLFVFAAEGSDNGELLRPTAIEIVNIGDGDGEKIYITDTGNNRIALFNVPIL